jgi:hypothetical protein
MLSGYLFTGAQKVFRIFYRNFIFTNFICYSGYDFGYLLKVLTCSPLPAEESEFFDLLRTYFPCIYDIKYLMKSFKNLKGGLQDIADDLQVNIYFVKFKKFLII